MNFIFQPEQQYFMNKRSEWIKYCFLPREDKIRIFKFFLLYRQEYFWANNSIRVGNDVIDILTSEDMENTPLESWMCFGMKFTGGQFSTKTKK